MQLESNCSIIYTRRHLFFVFLSNQIFPSASDFHPPAPQCSTAALHTVTSSLPLHALFPQSSRTLPTSCRHVSSPSLVLHLCSSSSWTSSLTVNHNKPADLAGPCLFWCLSLFRNRFICLNLMQKQRTLSKQWSYGVMRCLAVL